MFYYYGRKKKLVKMYPTPEHDTIIEPFAGAASYACAWGKNRRVVLVEKHPKVAALWNWLIHEATPEGVIEMPDLEVGQRTSDFLHILHAATKRAFEYRTIKVTPVLATNWNCNKRQMAKLLPLIRHWEVICGDYTEAPDVTATWYIDPPYRGDAGSGYECGSDAIDYDALAEWVRSRKGQVIVCGHADDNWLPFRPLVMQSTINGKRNHEGVFVLPNAEHPTGHAPARSAAEGR